jgi:hypothetical protein
MPLCRMERGACSGPLRSAFRWGRVIAKDIAKDIRMTDAQILALLLPPPSPSGLPLMQPFQLDPYSGYGQWVTYDQARQFAKFWNGSVSGLPFLPGNDSDPKATPPVNGWGIYKPFAVETYFPESKTGPDGVMYYWLAGRFLEVRTKLVYAGVDIGLMINQFYRYPYSSSMVISDLVQQILSLPSVPYQGA